MVQNDSTILRHGLRLDIICLKFQNQSLKKFIIKWKNGSVRYLANHSVLYTLYVIYRTRGSQPMDKTDYSMQIASCIIYYVFSSKVPIYTYKVSIPGFLEPRLLYFFFFFILPFLFYSTALHPYSRI